MNPEVQELLADALKHACQIREFVAGHDLSSYSRDPKTRMAVERSFEIIGESLNRIKRIDNGMLESIRDHRSIISFRNILAHAYDHIEDRIVWGIIETDLDQLVEDIETLLS
ncbi:MAG: DUF86 domain-containing protein [Oceanipulchritudo sp.]|jgi:uncharacterized protein with HEPN domain